MPVDKQQEYFDFGQELSPDIDSSCLRKKVPSAHVSVANNEHYKNFRETISDGANFKLGEDSKFPVAEYETSCGRDILELRPQVDEPLVPDEQDELARRIWERTAGLSETEGDVSDALMINYLKKAKSPNDRVEIDVDDICRMRGIKAHRSGSGRRGGYTQEQRLTVLKAAQAVFDTWITAVEQTIRGKRGTRVRRLDGPAFLITSRVGDHRFSWHDSSCHDNAVDVIRFRYTVGDVFGAYLFTPGQHQTALLAEVILKYNPRTQWWEKRLGHYYTYLWRIRKGKQDFSKPLKVSTIFAEGLRIEINSRRLKATQDHFGSCHRNLERDGVMSGWHWERKDGPWCDWTVVIEPPAVVMQHYLRRGPDSAGAVPELSSGELFPDG